MAYDRKGRERLGRITEEIGSILNKCEKEKNRGLTSEERNKFFALQGEYEAVHASIERFEHPSGPAIAEHGDLTEERMRDEFRLTPGARRERDRDPSARAFSRYLRNGMEGMESEDRQLMAARFMANSGVQNAQSTTGTQGGYVVPQGFSQQLEEAKKWFGGIDGVVGKFTTGSGNPWPWPTINDTANKGRIIGQNVQVTETDMVFGQVTFNAYIGSSDLVLVPQALMEDSYFDMDGLVARLLGTRLGRLYNN